MPRIEKTAILMALFLVLLVPAALMTKAALDRENGSVWQISIGGFDPRDLLRGQYLQFRYEWALGGEDRCGYAKTCCLCLNETAPGQRADPLAKIVACDDSSARRQCDAVVVGKGRSNPVSVNSQVYFIPEKYAHTLETALWGTDHDFKMEITVPRSGGAAVIRQLVIDQKPLDQFIQTLGAEKTTD